MLEKYFFSLGIVNSLSLIIVFLLRKSRLDLVQRFGWIYLFLALPAAFGIYLSFHERKSSPYAIFLGIFIAFLIFEWIYDFALKLDFRENWAHNWPFLVPYLALYYAMNYGFVVMPWKSSVGWGIIMLVLFIIQLAANILSHGRTIA